MEKLAKEVIGLTAKMYQTAEEESKENDMKELKKKSDEVHHMNRKIKNLIDTNNINEQMSRFFECLSDNMYEIYERQVNNAMLMEKLKIKDHYKINDLKFSFTNEIEKLIKER